MELDKFEAVKRHSLKTMTPLQTVRRHSWTKNRFSFIDDRTLQGVLFVSFLFLSEKIGHIREKSSSVPDNKADNVLLPRKRSQYTLSPTSKSTNDNTGAKIRKHTCFAKSAAPGSHHGTRRTLPPRPEHGAYRPH